MFSIQFSVCFYMILSVCHCHFGSTIYENCTKRINLIAKIKANLTKKNDTTVEYHAKDSTNVVTGLNRRVRNDILKAITVAGKNQSKDNIDKSTLNKNHSLLWVNLTQQIVTEKMNNTDDYIENRIESKNQSEYAKDTGEITASKNDIVEGQNAIFENENNTTISQNNSTDKNVNKYNITKNSEKYDLHKHLKNHMVENVTKNTQNHNMDENDQKFDSPKNFESKDKLKSVTNKTMTENNTKIDQNNIKDENVQNYDLLKNHENNDTLKSVKDETMSGNNTKFLQNYSMDNNILNDLPKNIQKRDIGMPEKLSNDIMPNAYQKYDSKLYEKYDGKNDQNYDGKNYQKYDDTNNQKYDSPNRYEKYETAKNIHNDDTIKNGNNYDKLKHANNINDYKYQNYEMNSIKNIDKNDVETENHTRRFDDNISHHAIPQIQTRLNNDLIKKSLGEFKMVRRITHYTLPKTDFKNDILKRDADRYQDLTYFHEYDDKERLNGARNHVNRDYHQYTNYDGNNDQSYEEPNMPHFKKLDDVLARQQEIVQKLAQIQLIARQKPQSDFAAIMAEVEAKKKKKNYTKLSFTTIPPKKIKTIKTTTETPTTIMTQFDETEIRKALKNDPHVNRILKMANLKREKYLDNVRSYVRNNYAHEKGNARNLAEVPSNFNLANAVERANLNSFAVIS